VKRTSDILVAGIGNIFLGDDAFGSEVARRLLQLPRMPGICVIDFGIRGLDLMYRLTDDCQAAILIDAVPRGEPPGTLFLLEPQIDSDESPELPVMLDAHSMDSLKVLRAAKAMGALPAQIFIVGCEPSPLPDDNEEEMQLEMSAPVRGAIDEAVVMVQQIISRVMVDRSDTLRAHEVISTPPALAAANSQEFPC
jgi:hydrogenase maturation protease